VISGTDLPDDEHAFVEHIRLGQSFRPFGGPPITITGEPDPRDWQRKPNLRGELLRELLLTPTGAGRLNGEPPFGSNTLTIQGVRISGKLDLSRFTAQRWLKLSGCWIDTPSPVDLTEAIVPGIELVGCWVPHGINAKRVTIQHNLRFAESTVQHGMILSEARINGQLDLHEAKLMSPNEGDQAALLAEGLHVAGLMNCENVNTIGPICLIKADIGDQLVLSGSNLTSRHRHRYRTLSADGLRVAGGMYCRQMHSIGEFRLSDAKIYGQFSLSDAILSNPDRADHLTLNADGLYVEGSMSCEKLRSTGEIRLVGAGIGGQLALPGAILSNPDHPEHRTLNADRIHVGGGVYCQNLESVGEVRLLGGAIDGQLVLTDARFTNPDHSDHKTISADRVRISGSMFCQNLRSTGEITLAGARVDGQLIFREANLRNSTGSYVLAAEGLSVGEAFVLEPIATKGEINLSLGRIGTWVDNDIARKTPTRCEGLQYDRLVPASPDLTARNRIAWIRRSPLGYTPQPYNQLAAVYRAEGHDNLARKVLVSSLTARRRKQPLWNPNRAIGLIFNILVGYGYRPWRALYWLVVVAALGTLVVSHLHNGAHQHQFTHTRGAPAFNSFYYTLSLLLPVVAFGNDLGYSNWTARGTAQTVSAALICVGWIITTAVAAGVASILKRSD
jgi:cytoskeletal protein CcmA (bactofilin family)